MRIREPFLYVIVDARKGILEKLKGIVDGGADIIQLRDKNLSARELIEIGLEMKAIIRGKALFFVNDRLDIALALSADGVHLGQDDLPVEAARSIAGKCFLVGLSTHDEKEVKNSCSKPVDYISFGPIFKTKTKLNALSPRGIRRLKEIVPYSKHPVVAIGGINKENIAEVLETGVKGVAISSAILDEKDSYRATLEIAKNL
jgi:thiamine-phosphate pyrophosphorylase